MEDEVKVPVEDESTEGVEIPTEVDESAAE